MKTSSLFNLIIPLLGIAAKGVIQKEKQPWTVYSCVIYNEERVETNVMPRNRRTIEHIAVYLYDTRPHGHFR